MLVQDETGKELLRYLKPAQDGSIKKLALVANPMAHSTAMFRRFRGRLWCFTTMHWGDFKIGTSG